MDKFLYYNDLFSIYKELLTTKEQEIFSLYYEENLSLSEIAENRSISRSAVGATIKIVEKKLEDYEKILKIHNRNNKINDLCEKIQDENLRKKLKQIIE